MRGVHHAIAKAPGALANLFEDSASNLAGARSERLKCGRSIVLLAQPTHCPKHRWTVAARRRWSHFATERALIFLFKRISAGILREANFSLSLAPEINSYIAVSVDVLDKKSIETDTALIAQPNLHHRSSHSFFAPAASSSASNASSSLIRSHTRRPSIRLGLGIRPSSTIASNFVTPTPIYSAAWARERPRGASESGKRLPVFRTIALLPHFAAATVETLLDRPPRVVIGLPHLIEGGRVLVLKPAIAGLHSIG